MFQDRYLVSPAERNKTSMCQVKKGPRFWYWMIPINSCYFVKLNVKKKELLVFLEFLFSSVACHQLVLAQLFQVVGAFSQNLQSFQQQELSLEQHTQSE